MESKEKLILIVEDEPKIAALLADYLRAQGGFQSKIVERGDEALEEFHSEQPDLVLLDLMLPGLDGIEVCKTTAGREPGAHNHGYGAGG